MGRKNVLKSGNLRVAEILENPSDEKIFHTTLDSWNSFIIKMGKDPDVRWLEDEELTIFESGEKIPVLNRVVKTKLSSEHVDEKIDEVKKYFREKGLPFHWQVGYADEPADLPKHLVKAGFDLDETPCMAVKLNELLVPPMRPGFRIERARTLEDVEKFARLMIPAYGMPDFLVDFWARVHRQIGLDEDYGVYIGYLNGKAVATSAMLFSDGVAGIYNVSTMPEARGMGMGSLMTAVPLVEARDLGYRIGVLQSSKMGYSVYLSLGFKEYGSMIGYIWNR